MRVFTFCTLALVISLSWVPLKAHSDDHDSALTLNEALKRADDRSLDFDSRYKAFDFLLEHPNSPAAVQKLILMIHADQDVEIVEEMSVRLNPSLIEESKPLIDHMVGLLNFEGFKSQTENQTSGKKVAPSENLQAMEVRLLVLRLLPAVVFRNSPVKSRVVKALYQFIDNSYEDSEIGHAIQALYEMGERGDEFVKRVLDAIQDPHSFNSKVWAMSILEENKWATENRDFRLAVIRALSQASWKKRVFEADEAPHYLTLSMSIMESGFGALGLKKALVPMLHSVERHQLIDPIPIQAVGTLAGALLERSLTRHEAGLVQQLRRLNLNPVGEALDLGDHEVAKRLKVETIVPQLRRAGFKDFNESTRISEIRALLESGLLGVYNPPADHCRMFLVDLGKPF